VTENGEDIQVLRYEHGQKYDAHFDYFHDKVNIVRGGHRMATILMYLSNVTKGGETVFPDAEVSAINEFLLSISPQDHSWVIFSYKDLILQIPSRRVLSENKEDLSDCAKRGIAGEKQNR